MTVKIWEEGVPDNGSTYVRLSNVTGGVFIKVVDYLGEDVYCGVIARITENGITRSHGFNDGEYIASEGRINIATKNSYVKQQKEFV